MDWSLFVSLALGVVVTCLASAIGWLFHTVGANKVAIAELRTALEAKLSTADAAEKYVNRESYVPRMTLLNQKLDSLGETLARVDERSQRWDKQQ